MPVSVLAIERRVRGSPCPQETYLGVGRRLGDWKPSARVRQVGYHGNILVRHLLQRESNVCCRCFFSGGSRAKQCRWN